jgi:tRNA(Arg) A34 adenosine deaminase TadA|tara:strand:- start:30 stop:620 length:591 start_codon:yes stop_codon:yes gene_type:complete
MNEKALETILNVFLKEVLPLTEKGVAKGSKVFGAAIIKKDDLSVVIAETNNEIENPLWHGEMHALKKFYELDANTRPNEKECMFLSSHEPCSMCLSAITFSGFDNFYFLFPYNDTNDEFNIPHDLNILKEVFKINDGEYNKENSYWKSQNINLLIEKLPTSKKEKILSQLREIKKKYQKLSNQYQENKDGNSIPLN